MTVSIIIPTRNEEKYIAGCIESLLANVINGLHVEIIVVDGMSTDNTASIVGSLIDRGLPIRLVRNPLKITPVALNIGIQESRGDYLLFSGAHAAYPSDYISTCLTVMEETPDAWCVGGSIETVSDTVVGQAIADAMSSPFGVGNAKFRLGAHNGYVDTLTFGCYPRWVFEKIGNFDESLVRNQDDDLNLRITEAGGKLYMDSRIHSRYYSRSSLRHLFKQYFQYGFWRTKTLAKHRTVASLRQVVPAMFILYLCGIIALLFLFPSHTYWAGLLLATYFVFLLCGAIDVAKRASLRSAFFAPLIFFILHFAYGLGFWRGVVAWAKRKDDNNNYSSLSR